MSKQPADASDQPPPLGGSSARSPRDSDDAPRGDADQTLVKPSASDDSTLDHRSPTGEQPAGEQPRGDEQAGDDRAGDDQTLVKPRDDATVGHPGPSGDDQTLVKPPQDRAPEDSAPGAGDSDSPDDGATMQVADPAQVARQAAELLRATPAADDEVKPFGDYDLLSVIAKGGMGVVYKARQRKLNRIVAIKMILSGQLADATDISRFYAEAEAAANLRHTNIVGIYEIGEVDGQHFFSMEYIEGKSLGDLSRDHPLPPERAAAYVKKIAEAMEFAHQRGILHRDLKPSNVLVDGRDEPLITDFGLAKRVEGHSQLTMTGAIVGTPSYMPPEQARGQLDRLDATSDVYSTGAILYELLTGSPPFRSSSPFETLRQVLSAEPAAPRVVNPSIPRDLETICLKALQKEQSARYSSERELADELGRFLAGEPIQARPIGHAARLWRWCRRNPAVASLSAAALLFLVLALVGTSVGMVRARIAQAQSDASFRDSREAVDDMFTRVSQNDLLNQPGLQPLRHELLQRALAYYQKFLRQRGDDPTVRSELASTFYRIGYITAELESPQDALPWFRKALNIQQEAVRRQGNATAFNALGDTWNQVGVVRHKMKHVPEAKAAYAEAIDARQRVIELAPQQTEHHRVLANSLMNLAMLLRDEGEVEEARERMLAAQKIRGDLLEQGRRELNLRRDYAQGFFNLAVLEWQVEAVDEADRQFASAQRQFTELLDEAPENLWNQWRLATCLRTRADMNAQRLDDQATTASDDRPAPLQRVVATYTEAEGLLARLSLRNPEVIEYKAALAHLLMNLGALQQRFSLDRDALESLDRAVTVLAEIVEQEPTIRHRRDLAATRCELAVQLALDRQLDKARQQLDESRTALQRLREELQDTAAYDAELSRVEQIGQWLAAQQP